jgi:predicted anti-sigma-YlaC factor YlaD
MRALDRIRRKFWPGKPAEPLACNELVEIITEYLEGTLPPRDLARFDTHLGQCEGCRIYLEQMRQTIRVVGHLSEETIPPPAKEELLRAFSAWKQR